MERPSFIPDHVQVRNGAMYRQRSHRLTVSLNGAALGQLVDLGDGKWGWDDSTMGTGWYWNVEADVMRGWLVRRCLRAYPEEGVRELWSKFRALVKAHGRYAEESAKEQAAFVAQIANLIA